MSEFKVIETQEQLEEVLKDRLERAEKKHSEEIKPLQEKITGYETQIGELTKAKETLAKTIKETTDKYAVTDKTIEELTSKVKNYEMDSAKTKIANEFKLPYELKDTIQGNDEESMRKSAETLAKYVKPDSMPPAQGEPPVRDDKAAAYKQLAKDLVD